MPTFPTAIQIAFSFSMPLARLSVDTGIVAENINVCFE
jgi:hypothetical protein